jgi:uncharacterized protein (DUF4415 family)
MSRVRVKSEDLKPLTKADRARLRKVMKRPIDYSDIPELDEAWFARAKRGAAAASQPKSQVAFRLDNDVIAWFRAQGPGYQSRVNAILRAYMEASTASSPG